jgi:hypothetical protein
MERFWETTKKHPYLIGGAVLVGVLAIWYFSSSGSSSTQTAGGVYSPTADPNVVAANASMQNQQVQANAAIDLAALQAAVQKDTIKASTDQMQIQANVANNAYTLQANVANNTVNAQLAAIQAQIGGQENINASNNATTLGMGNLQLQAVNAQYQAASAINQQNVGGAVDIAGLTANSNTALATIAANQNISLAGIQQQTAMSTQSGMYATVSNLYQTVLGRMPDTAGLQYWANSGLNVSQLTAAFQQSAEHTSGNPLSGWTGLNTRVG